MSENQTIAIRSPPPGCNSDAILAVRNVSITIGDIEAVHGVSIALRRGQTLCLVGESGCGKSLTCLALMGLLPAGARMKEGTFELDGHPYEGASVRIQRRLPGLAMISQDATASLNPVMTIGAQISEPLRILAGFSAAQAKAETLRLLDQVGIADPRRRFSAYPHELSGGMNQRVAIAMALACRPRVLIADEPTTALDVTVQAQILRLLQQIQAETALSLLLVTHDLGVVAEIAHEVAVMYAGQIVEQQDVDSLFEHPAHPYTRALLACLPRGSAYEGRLASIPGTVPGLLDRMNGCSFATRCERAQSECHKHAPEVLVFQAGGAVSCHHPLTRDLGNGCDR